MNGFDWIFFITLLMGYYHAEFLFLSQKKIFLFFFYKKETKTEISKLLKLTIFFRIKSNKKIIQSRGKRKGLAGGVWEFLNFFPLLNQHY